MVRKSNLQSSTYNSSLRTIKISSLILMIFILIIGSQEIINSYPADILISDTTRFNTSFDSISPDHVIIGENQIKISEGDVITLSTGGYLKFKAAQVSTNEREAYKYNKFKLNQILLFSQTIYEWNHDLYNPVTISTNNPDQLINLYYFSNKVRVNTFLSTYDIIGDQSTFITTDDGEILYQLVTENDIIKIKAIGVYNSIQFKISATGI